MWIDLGLLALGALLMLALRWVRDRAQDAREDKRERARRAAAIEGALLSATQEVRGGLYEVQQRLLCVEGHVEFMRPIVTHLSKKDSGVL